MATNLKSSQTENNRPVVNWLRAGANVAIIGLWIWLYWPLTAYFSVIFYREDFRTNQIVLLGVIALIVSRIRRNAFRIRFDAPPQLARLPLALVIGGSTGYLIVERFLDINTLSATLFGLATYGLLGLWISRHRWKGGLPAALLLIGALPFGEHLQTFVGYPMRIFSADVVRRGLAAAGITSVGVDTILVFENGVSQIDLPCSGVKSLWTGALFIIAATWIERRPLNGYWVLVAAIFAGLLFAANLIRVAILVAVGQVMEQQLIAEMLHVPLGVLAFVAVCAVGVWLLRLRTLPSYTEVQPGRSVSRPAWLAPVLAIFIAALALLYVPRPQSGLTQPSPTWGFPPELVTEPLPLKPDELEWLTREGAMSADRRRFEWRDLSGTMILITSDTWRGHHRPERCFEVYGLSIDDSQAQLVAPDFPVRWVSLGDGNRRNLHSAAYWFQSAAQTTDDYGTRIWADLPPNRARWVLVSMVFDGEVDPQSADVRDFYQALHKAVDAYFGSRSKVQDLMLNVEPEALNL